MTAALLVLPPPAAPRPRSVATYTGSLAPSPSPALRFTNVSLKVRYIVPDGYAPPSTAPTISLASAASPGSPLFSFNNPVVVPGSSSSGFVNPAPEASLCTSLDIGALFTIDTSADPFASSGLVSRDVNVTCYDPDTGAVLSSSTGTTLNVTSRAVLTTW